KVALLGKTVAGNVFGDADPVGQVIRIKNVPFTVQGVLSAKGQSPTGQDQDDIIILPLTTAKKKVLGASQANLNSIGSMMVQSNGTKMMQEAQLEIRDLLRQRHQLQPEQEDDFMVRNMEEIFAAQETSASVMSILLGEVSCAAKISSML